MSFRTRALDRAASLWSALPTPLRRSIIQASNDRFPVGAVGIVQDESRRVLLLEHRFRAPWPWGLPGGFIRHGETLEAGLARELMEELGVEVEVEPAIIDTELNVAMRYVSVTLVARVHHGVRLSFSGEISASGFFGPDDLPRGTYPYHAQLLRRFCGGGSMEDALRTQPQAT